MADSKSTGIRPDPTALERLERAFDSDLLDALALISTVRTALYAPEHADLEAVLEMAERRVSNGRALVELALKEIGGASAAPSASGKSGRSEAQRGGEADAVQRAYLRGHRDGIWHCQQAIEERARDLGMDRLDRDGSFVAPQRAAPSASGKKSTSATGATTGRERTGAEQEPAGVERIRAAFEGQLVDCLCLTGTILESMCDMSGDEIVNLRGSICVLEKLLAEGREEIDVGLLEIDKRRRRGEKVTP